MTRVLAYQHGIYPRSEAVVAATRDVERGRTTPELVAARYRDDREAFVAAQREANLDLFSDGLLTWQDLFRPLVEAAPGMRARTLVRWFDTNSFYRAPELEGAPGRIDGLPAEFDGVAGAVPAPRVATLPSPWLFSRAAHPAGPGSGEADRLDRNALMRDLGGDVLAPVAARLPDLGYEVVHLQEPWLAYVGDDGDAEGWKAFDEALGSVRDALGGRAALVLHLSFGDAAPHAERLRALPVDAIGIDFVETDLGALGRDWGIGVLAGCLDGRRSLVERPEEVSAFAERVAETLAPSTLYLSSNSELEMLPAEVARRKVLALGEAAAAAKEALA